MKPVPVIPYSGRGGVSTAARRRSIAAAVAAALFLAVAFGFYQWSRAVAMEADRAQMRARAAKQFELSRAAVRQAATQQAADE